MQFSCTSTPIFAQKPAKIIIFPAYLTHKPRKTLILCTPTPSSLAYCAEIGLRCDITPQLGLFAAYQISGSSARPKRTPQDEWDTDTYTSPRQYYNTIRAGLTYTF